MDLRLAIRCHAPSRASSAGMSAMGEADWAEGGPCCELRSSSAAILVYRGSCARCAHGALEARRQPPRLSLSPQPSSHSWLLARHWPVSKMSIANLWNSTAENSCACPAAATGCAAKEASAADMAAVIKMSREWSAGKALPDSLSTGTPADTCAWGLRQARTKRVGQRRARLACLCSLKALGLRRLIRCEGPHGEPLRSCADQACAGWVRSPWQSCDYNRNSTCV